MLQVAAGSYNTARLFACAIHKKSYPNHDPVELAFEDLCQRFDFFLQRLRAQGDQQRANGAKSRGPKTAATRAISSRNSLTHGLTSWSTLVLQNESQEEFARVLAHFTAAFAPATTAETEFLNEMVAARWRMRRLWTIETALLDTEIDRQRPVIAREFSRTDEGPL